MSLPAMKFMFSSSPAGGPRDGNVESAVLLALDTEELADSVHDLIGKLAKE